MMLPKINRDRIALDTMMKHMDDFITVHEWNIYMKKANALYEAGDNEASRLLAQEIENKFKPVI